MAEETKKKKREKKSTLALVPEQLEKLTKEELIDFIIEHKREIVVCPTKAQPELPDFSKAEFLHAAFSIAYCGHNYQGLVVQANTHDTVEARLFEALRRTCLIDDWKKCMYTRCGRTDAGVSAMKNVVSLWIRKIPTKRPGCEFDDYCKAINHQLPPDIRIIGWSPVQHSFNARYSCLFREYLYYFVAEDMIIERMRMAAGKFVGKHNFMHFCKADSAKEPNYTRVVYKSEIRAIRAASDSKLSIYALYVKGSSFLWHQIRCMAAVLFMIGKSQEDVSFIDYMLDPSKCLTKPMYTLASEKPLILANCGFEDVFFKDTLTGSIETHDKIKGLCTEKALEFCIYNTMYSHFSGLVVTSAQVLKHLPDVQPQELKKPYLTWEEATQFVKTRKRLKWLQKKDAQKQSKVKKHKPEAPPSTQSTSHPNFSHTP